MELEFLSTVLFLQVIILNCYIRPHYNLQNCKVWRTIYWVR